MSRATLLCRCTFVTANDLVLSCTEKFLSSVYEVHYLHSFVKYFLLGLKSCCYQERNDDNCTMCNLRFTYCLMCVICTKKYKPNLCNYVRSYQA